MSDLPTFESVLAETKVSNRKADLSSLAHAHVELTRHRINLIEAHAKALEKIDETLAEIAATGAKEDVSKDDVYKTYQKANALYR